MKTTTLNEISEYEPCDSGWDTLLESLGKDKADNEPLTLKHILKSNGIEDAIWALRVLDYKDKCLFMADVAESVLHIYESKYDDMRPREAIQAVRDFHAGKISKDKLGEKNNAAADAAAYYAADAAAYYAADAAADAAYYAADAAAYYAADAAADAAYYAADAAAYYAADAAADAANAADAAAYYAADAAADAANAADAAADAAKKEKWVEIEQLFIKHFC